MSHLRDAASWIWPWGMCWHRSSVARAVKADSEGQEEGVTEVPARDAWIRSWRLLASEPGEKRKVIIRRKRWTKRR